MTQVGVFLRMGAVCMVLGMVMWTEQPAGSGQIGSVTTHHT